MRATLDAALFAKAVKAVAPVASRVTHIAALGCVRLDFTGDQVRLLASDGATIDALGEWPDPVRFRPDQLVACIKATGVDTVKFGAFTNRKPVLIEGGDVGQFVMPVAPV